MSFVKNLIQKSSAYMICEIVIMLGGFISFPIFTRLLTKQEYGMMNIISISISLAEEFSTLGIRHAVNRYYSTYNLNEKLSFFYSTTMVSSFIFGIVGTVITILVSILLAKLGIIENNLSNIILIAALLIVTRVISKVIGTMFRMLNLVKTYSILAVLTKYLGMGVSIVLVSVYMYGIKGFFIGLVVGEIVSLILILFVILKHLGLPSSSRYSHSILKEMITYGFPLIVAGFATTLLTIGDRYLIALFMSADDVAIYCVPYNFCSYILGVFVTGFEFAYFPLIMNEWRNGENEKVRQGIVRIIQIYCMFALPIIFGVSALGERIIKVVASNKYAEASYILPYVITGEMIMGISTPLMIGFVLMNKTGMILKCKWYAVLVNISLNLVLIPTMGLKGAALATLCSYVFFVVIGAWKSFKHFVINVPYRAISIYSACSFVMFIIINGLNEFIPDLNLISLIFAGVLTYMLLLISFDKDVRRITASGLLKISQKI